MFIYYQEYNDACRYVNHNVSYTQFHASHISNANLFSKTKGAYYNPNFSLANLLRIILDNLFFLFRQLLLIHVVYNCQRIKFSMTRLLDFKQCYLILRYRYIWRFASWLKLHIKFFILFPPHTFSCLQLSKYELQ